MNLTELKELHKKTTPGIWQVDEFAYIKAGLGESDFIAGGAYDEGLSNPNDAHFIVAAHGSVPLLIEEIETLREALDQCGKWAAAALSSTFPNESLALVDIETLCKQALSDSKNMKLIGILK